MGAINGQANIGLRGEARIGKTMWPFSRKNGTYFAGGKPGEGRGWGDGKRVTMEWHANREWIVWGKSSTALTIGNLSPRNHSLDKQVLPLFPSSLTPYGCALFPIRSFKQIPPLDRVPRYSRNHDRLDGWIFRKKNDPSRTRALPLLSPCTPHVRDKMQIPRFHDLTSGRVLIARTKTLARSN